MEEIPMQTKFFKVLMLLVFLCSVPVVDLRSQAAVDSSQGPPPSYITVYKEEGFRGESEKFLIGQYPKLDDRWKDEIKSVALMGSVRATLFDKEQFGGRKVLVEQSLYKLPGEMRGETASLIVEAFTCAYAIAYKDTTYRGESRQFPVGEYPKLDGGFKDMESMELCGQVNVTLFTKENYQGDSTTLNLDRIDLGKFRKKVKSMKVEASSN
jgi:hypothetical protein